MVNGDNRLCMTLLHIIKKKVDIHAFDLIDEANITLSVYNRIKPYFLHKFVAQISYDKSTKMWRNINPENNETKILQEVLKNGN